jgi:hypothetical protein
MNDRSKPIGVHGLERWLNAMHCRVAHCRRMICDQGEFREEGLLGIVGEALLVLFCERQGRFEVGSSSTSCYAIAARFDSGMHAVCLLFAAVSTFVSILPGLAIEASEQAASIHLNNCRRYELQLITRRALCV